MKKIWAKQALLPEGWRDDIAIEVSADGRIETVSSRAPGEDHFMVGVLMPAPVNGHSHSFQRAMAGLSERRGEHSSDSFWTWRQTMYRFLAQITPEQFQAITAFVQMEMLEAGYATNVEFHYLHHQADGTPYTDLSEMSARVAAAASDSGIGLTLLPVAYRYGGCDGRPLGLGQRRFGNDPDRFVRLVEGAERALRALPSDTILGVAPHSLRAIATESLVDLAALRPRSPIHMHLAETLAEVDEVQETLGSTPVTWMLENTELSSRWCLIHITQMQPSETESLAATGAIAGLCPLTEASLGDGIFDGIRWMNSGGSISLGSDSNIRISLAEELRQLDTSQRLRDHSRASFALAEKSAGRRLLEEVARGGAKAAGRESGAIKLGVFADLLSLDMSHPDLEGLQGDTVIDSFVFSGDNRMVEHLWSAGRHVVRNGRHIRRELITTAYKDAVRSLRDGF